ncbi:hypothetical protein [Sphingomonas oleivorans]|uniref:hypothetical protein n=1 Tax=Sphingomonas oleivorans TaxID=1735121 RepID=UPI0013FE4914|nr:hypothetical protein [Sphingomonas oleivorans]
MVGMIIFGAAGRGVCTTHIVLPNLFRHPFLIRTVARTWAWTVKQVQGGDGFA